LDTRVLALEQPNENADPIGRVGDVGYDDPNALLVVAAPR
jgi:hypothetical protein